MLQVQSPAVYDSAAYGVPRVKQECAVDSTVAEHVFRKIVDKYPDTQQIQDPAKMETGKVLKLTILSVQGIGGGGWTGSKGITVRADLVQDGRTIQTLVRKERSRGGLFGPVMGTCAILDEVSESLGQYFAIWLSKLDATPAGSSATAASAQPAFGAAASPADQINDQAEP